MRCFWSRGELQQLVELQFFSLRWQAWENAFPFGLMYIDSRVEVVLGLLKISVVNTEVIIEKKLVK